MTTRSWWWPHSLAGATGALVPARRPVRHLVYLCAAVPEGGLSLLPTDGFRD